MTRTVLSLACIGLCITQSSCTIYAVRTFYYLSLSVRDDSVLAKVAEILSGLGQEEETEYIRGLFAERAARRRKAAPAPLLSLAPNFNRSCRVNVHKSQGHLQLFVIVDHRTGLKRALNERERIYRSLEEGRIVCEKRADPAEQAIDIIALAPGGGTRAV